MAVLLGASARSISSIRSSRVRRTTVGVAVLGVIAAYGVVSPSWAMAGSLSGSTFEIDGAPAVAPAVTDANLVIDSAGHVDWLDASKAMDNCTPPQVVNCDQVKFDLPTGTSDDSFTQGTDINTPAPGSPATVNEGSIPNGKSDLKAFGLRVEAPSASADPIINVFWSRVTVPNGTTTMDFEFNQSSTRSNDWGSKADGLPYYPTHVIPVRQAGDILISYLLGNGGTNPHLTKRVWNGTAWGTETGFSTTDALAAINTSSITAANSGGLGSLSPLTFGEASLKLSAFASGLDTCTTFGSAYLRSRSSDTDTDENKDFIAPLDISISNCGRINIHKTESTNTGAHTALDGAVFTLYKDVTPTGDADGQTAAGAEDKTLANTVDACTTADGGDCSFTDVPKGQYWVVETTTPGGHDTAPDQHVTITAGDQVENLTFDDPIQYGTIVVQKQASPADGTDFSFTRDGSGFQLDVDSDPTLPSQRTFTVPVGSHTVAEGTEPTGWSLDASNCRDAGTVVSSTTNTSSLSFDLAAGHTVTCVFINSYSATTPTVATTATNSVENTTWYDHATVTGDGTHAVSGSVTFYVCGPTTPDCTTGGGQVGTAVTLVNGVANSAGFTPTYAGNYCFRAEYDPGTNPYYTTASHTNATTECFTKQNADLTVTKDAHPAFGRAYSWDVTKVVDGDASVEVPAGTKHAFPYKVSVTHSSTDNTWTVTGQITVHNSNNVAFHGVDVSDAIDNGGVCTVTGGSNVDVPANGTAVLDYVCTYASAPSSDTGTNTATATWDAAASFTPHGTASGTAPVDFGNATVTTTDQVVTVTDTLGGVLGTLDGGDPELANPAVFTYSIEQTAPEGDCATYPNTASVTTIRTIDDVRTTVTLDSASASATLCGGLPLGVSATAGGSFDRTYQWLIDKSVDNTKITVDNGKTGTFNYTVTVTPNGALDSGYALSGTVTVENPNLWEDITADVTVSTDLGGGADCTVVDGEDAVIPMDDGVSFAYSCTFTGTPTMTGTVTATAAWDATAAATTDSSATAPVPVSLALATETNRTITVTDDKTDPANPVQLGTWTFDDGAHSFTYALTKEGVPGTAAGPACVDYTNVAMIVETQQSDTQVATLCHTFTGGGGTPVVNPPQGGGLPFTGDGIGLMAREAIGLILAGLLLLVLNRRKRQAA